MPFKALHNRLDCEKGPLRTTLSDRTVYRVDQKEGPHSLCWPQPFSVAETVHRGWRERVRAGLFMHKLFKVDSLQAALVSLSLLLSFVFTSPFELLQTRFYAFDFTLQRCF